MADNWAYMKARDAISGKEGTLYVQIDGENKPVAECKSIEAKITKNKSEFKALGHRGTQHKATGWSGTGSMTIYYASSRWAKMMIDYAHTGVDQYFTLVITNEDPTTGENGIGKQRLTLLDVNLDEADIAKLDTESKFLESSISFTFSDVILNDEFGELNQ